jgi:hypothetical protein
MSAEFIIAVISYKKPKRMKPGKWASEFHKRVARVLKACEKAKTFGEGGVKAYFDGVYGEPERHLHFDNPIEEVRAEFMSVIRDFDHCIDYRDTTTLNYPERFILLTGGMSWGDAPTDSYSTIDKFQQLPMQLLKAGGFE